MTFEHNPPMLKLLGAALVVEDNPIIAIDTQAILEDLGFSPVEVLSTLSEGLQTLANHIGNLGVSNSELTAVMTERCMRAQLTQRCRTGSVSGSRKCRSHLFQNSESACSWHEG